TERVAQDRIVLDRFPDYWNKSAIHFDRIVFLPIVDSTVRLANLQSGGLDLIERVAATDVDTVKKDGRLKLAEITGLGYTGITMNGPTIPETLQAAQVIQSMAAESGFDIKIQATEFASSLDLAVKGDYEAYLIGWSGRTDPDGNIYNFVSCKAPPALNTGHYC